jgi:cation diffusion facilitator family transporter
MENKSIGYEKRRVALTSILAAVLITAAKLVVGLVTNSLGLLSEAAHSGLDLVAAIMTYFAVSVADRPPDERHPYGHGKVENVSAFVETLILVITCIWIVKEAISRLLSGGVEVEANIWSFVVIGAAMLIDIGRSRALSRIAKKYNSQALEADALHFSSDVWSSAVVFAGLFLVRLGYVWVDAVAAIGVAILVMFVSYRLGRRTVDALMDGLPDESAGQLQSAVRSVAGVGEIRSFRLRQSGARIFLDATVTISRTIPFREAHAIMDNIEKAVHALRPDADVVVHAEPFESNDESVADKIRMIALDHGLRSPHNLEIHQTHGVYHIDFDIEYDPGKTLDEAHAATSEIENDIHRKIPSVGSVTIHMEEIQAGELRVGAEIRRNPELENDIRKVVLSDTRVLSCPGVNLLAVEDKYNLALVCTFEKSRTLGDVHGIICDVEGKLYDRFKELRRITIHAEPAGETN